jgi:hypothetical protein
MRWRVGVCAVATQLVTFINNNREWLFEGLGVSILGAVVFVIWRFAVRSNEQPPTTIEQRQVGGDASHNVQIGSMVSDRTKSGQQ